MIQWKQSRFNWSVFMELYRFETNKTHLNWRQTSITTLLHRLPHNLANFPKQQCLSFLASFHGHQPRSRGSPNEFLALKIINFIQTLTLPFSAQLGLRAAVNIALEFRRLPSNQMEKADPSRLDHDIVYAVVLWCCALVVVADLSPTDSCSLFGLRRRKRNHKWPTTTRAACFRSCSCERKWCKNHLSGVFYVFLEAF